MQNFWVNFFKNGCFNTQKARNCTFFGLTFDVSLCNQLNLHNIYVLNRLNLLNPLRYSLISILNLLIPKELIDKVRILKIFLACLNFYDYND